MTDTEINKKIQELQVLEQNLQSTFMQKQSLQMELNEVLNASSEVSKSSGEVYKIIGSLMLKAKKEEVEKDLGEKKDMLYLKISSLEKQENLLSSKINEISSDISGKSVVKQKK